MATIVSTSLNTFDYIESHQFINERYKHNAMHYAMSRSSVLPPAWQSFTKETAPHISDYLGIDFMGFSGNITDINGSVILTLSQTADSSETSIKGKKSRMVDDVKASYGDDTIRQLSDIDWDKVADLLSHFDPERSEENIELLAAGYAIQRARILESQMSDTEKQMAQDQLSTIYVGVKEKLGNEMQDELHSFLAKGGSNADYSGMANAISKIVDNRAEDYVTLLSSLMQKDEFRTYYSGGTLVLRMYQQKYSAQRSKSDDEAVSIGEQKYTYGEIKGVFEAIHYMSRKTAFIDDPSLYVSDSSALKQINQTNSDIFFGFYGMAFSMLINKYSNGQLSDDVYSALMGRFEKGAEKLKVDFDKVMVSVRSFNKILESDNFSSDLIKEFLSYSPQWYGALKMGIHMRDWKWLLEESNNIDKKYYIGIDTYV